MKIFLSFFLSLLFISAAAQKIDSSLLIRRALFNVSVKNIDWTYRTSSEKYLRPQQVMVPIGAVIYGVLSLESREMHRWNQEAKEEILEHNDLFKTRVDNYLQFAPVAAVYGLSATGVKTTHNFKDRTIILGMSTLIMATTVATLKKATHQLRPDGSAYNSFPSGHTATAFSGAAFMHQEFKNQSPLLSYSGYAMAAGTAVLRIYNNRHWLSDVVMGAGIGMLSTRASYWLFDKMKKKKVKAQR